jgi:predicted RNA-binding Zn-ribbon protein involved in translation (DUF1610 family)
MTNITRFPSALDCSSCGAKLRPAKGAEIRRGRQDGNATIRQAFAHAVQGDMARKVTGAGELPELLESETPEGSWVMICDNCGQVAVDIREQTTE